MGFLIGLVIVVLLLGLILTAAAAIAVVMIYVAVVGFTTLACYSIFTLATGNPIFGLLAAIAGLVCSVLLIAKLGETKPEVKSEPVAGSK